VRDVLDPLDDRPDIPIGNERLDVSDNGPESRLNLDLRARHQVETQQLDGVAVLFRLRQRVVSADHFVDLLC
jgi:hypothetical protein